MLKDESKNILIVEDELISAEYLKEMLIDAGYHVVNIVATAERAIAQYKLLKPDLVLMDIMLKGNMSGSEAALQVKHYDTQAKIIFLTAFATQEMVDYAVSTEAYGYLMKPYREEEILATIKLAFNNIHATEVEACADNIALKNGYQYNVTHNRLMKGSSEVPLGIKKLKLIEILAKNRNTSVSNEQLCAFIWGEYKSDDTLRSLIHRIRGVIGNEMIKNVNGMGYEMVT